MSGLTRAQRWSMAKKSLPPLILLGVILLPTLLNSAEIPSLTLKLSAGKTEPQKISVLLEILFILTILSVAPAIMLTVTSFTRIIIVFSFLRQALGIQHLPPNQVLVSLAIFMTFVIMLPVGEQINKNAVQPYLKEQIGFKDALEKAEKPLRKFLFKNTREKELSLIYSITHKKRPKSKKDISTLILIPAFMLSELKTAFEIGFMLYVPFLIIDMVVASILLSMGMMMLPPVMISLPFKILLFVLVDGWNLLVGSLMRSFY